MQRLHGADMLLLVNRLVSEVMPQTFDRTEITTAVSDSTGENCSRDLRRRVVVSLNALKRNGLIEETSETRAKNQTPVIIYTKLTSKTEEPQPTAP